MESQSLDIVHKRISQYIQIRYSTSDSAPNEGSVTNFSAERDFTHGCPQYDLRQRIHKLQM